MTASATGDHPPPSVAARAAEAALVASLADEAARRRELERLLEAERRARSEIDRLLRAEREEQGRLRRALADARTQAQAVSGSSAGFAGSTELDELRAQIRVLQGELLAQSDYAAEALLAVARKAQPTLSPRPRARWSGALKDLLLSAVRIRTEGVRGAARTFRAMRVIRASGEFDEAFYRATRPDLQGARFDPIRHYVLFGAAEGLDPSPAFSSASYVEAHPDVATGAGNPYAHYLLTGRAEGRYVPTSARLVESGPRTRGVHWVSGVEPAPAPAPARGGWTDWILARNPSRDPATLDLYDRRPDDSVPAEAARGREFLQTYGLLDEGPDFAGAVRALNASEPASPVVASDEEPAPDVTVLIPVYGQLAYTLNCLDALLRHRSRRSFEIIVVDDASPDATAEHLPKLSGVVYRRQPSNGGFIESCNAGARLARGKHLVLLNNDTRVVEGWLDGLIDAFELFPRAGLVGSKLLYPDGALQEAGGILWRDGSAWNYGRNADPNRPEFCYARQVDYVSGASIAIPTALWAAMGGFDERYKPAYSEDSDLAMRLREGGHEVWMQPLSRVIHYEGRTSGTDLTKGAKAYQVTNQATFVERWGPSLKGHRENGRQPHLERERGVRKRVLVLDATTPTPDQDAGSVTTVKVISVFQQLGYKVVFAPADNLLFERRYTPDLQRGGVECLYAPFVPTLESHLSEFGHLYDVVHVFRHTVMHRVAASVRKHCPKAKIVFNNMDLHYLRLERQAALERSDRLVREAAALKALELRTMAQADVVCVPSTEERRLLAAEGLGSAATVMPFMVDICPPVAAPAERRDLVFLGGFRHTPNVDAVTWFVRAVWGEVSKAIPKAHFVVVGANPPEEVRKLAGPRIEVTGRVDRLEPMFERARVFVAPLRFGAGVKGKIYAALAHGVPVVTTSVGAEGMGLEDGRQALVADDPKAFAQAVSRLFEDEALWLKLSAEGLAFVRENSTLDAGVRAMSEALARV